jgi:UDP-2-acetamido-3-amino-2,3-dideoxy-glucuronate N-acetyltransferase
VSDASNNAAVQIHPTAIVEKGAQIGRGTRVWHYAHVRSGAVIGCDCVLGKDVYVAEGARIGDNVHVQNGVSVYNGVTLEDQVFVGPHVNFTNDRYPRADNREWELVPTLVCHGASIGAGATILCGTVIGSYAMVGAGSVVLYDVPEHILVFGNPARLSGFVCYCGKPIAVIAQDDSRIIGHCNRCDRELVFAGESLVRIAAFVTTPVRRALHGWTGGALPPTSEDDDQQVPMPQEPEA